MTALALRHFEASEQALHFASLAPVRLGMPELCRAGLSENWLWKACGHRHWHALSAAHGLDRPDFRTAAGQRLYPAFVRVTLRDGHLNEVAEDDILTFAVRLERCGATRFASDILVHAGGRAIASLRMESVFLRRTIAGANLSATRDTVARPCTLAVPPSRRPLMTTAEENVAVAPHATTYRHVVDPNPWEDFNGADFLYFAAFQSMIDRAEWTCLGAHNPPRVTRRREITFLGNVELGDSVEVALWVSDDHTEHRAALRRVSDNRLIAQAVTSRSAS